MDSIRKSKKLMSREKMIRYFARHKLKKKQPRIRPRTFLNTQGLCTARLKPATQTSKNEGHKPVINNNVKARLESNLKHLLEHQNGVVRRVKPAESYFSLKFDKPKIPKNAKQTANENQSHQSNKTQKSELRPSESRKENSNDGESFSFPTRPYKPKQVQRKPSSPLVVDTPSSFGFDTIKDQIRAGDGYATPFLSGFRSDFSKNFDNNDFFFDEPTFTEPPSVSPSNFDFSPPCQFRPKPPHPKSSKHFRTEHSGSIVSNASGKTRTRIIKTSISRFGGSPIMQKIVIQKIKIAE